MFKKLFKILKAYNKDQITPHQVVVLYNTTFDDPFEKIDIVLILKLLHFRITKEEQTTIELRYDGNVKEYFSKEIPKHFYSLCSKMKADKACVLL